jgi:undecaprenyl-diphosphatase
MNFIQILILGVVQGAAELLPVSSSAHVIVAEKLMGIDPSSPEATFLLVMLHTGTMFAVIVYFWKSWGARYFSNSATLGVVAINLIAATAITVVVGGVLKEVIEHVFLHGHAKAEVEELFRNLWLIAGALLAAGVLILYSGVREEKTRNEGDMDLGKSLIVGAVQGLCLPFRGFSRSGATISTGLLLGVERRLIEEFSFALAVVLTPFADGYETWRLLKAHPEIKQNGALMALVTPGLVGMVCSFVAGYLALKLLSSLLETGRWKYFGVYCLVAALAVFGLAYVDIPVPAVTITVQDQSAPAPAAPETNSPVVQPLAPATNDATLGPLPATNAPAAQPLLPAASVSTNAAPDSPVPAPVNTPTAPQ